MKPEPAVASLMMVDDEQDDAVIFAHRLKMAGIRNPLLHFRHGGDAFMYLKQFCTGEKDAAHRPSVLFLDVNMPDLSGFDILVWARRQPALKGMRIIMLSGATEPWDAKIARALGANGYVMKFPESGELVAMLAPRPPESGRAEAPSTSDPVPTPFR